MSLEILIVPGLNNSGPDHWQTLWEKDNPEYKRIQQKDWDNPDCMEWVNKIEQTVKLQGENVIIVAHSLGCLAFVHWVSNTKLKIRGAMLVAPPDIESPAFPKEAKYFSPIPLDALPIKSILVGSENDPYISIERGKHFASQWGCRFINVGAKGHINANSNLGNWEEGKIYLNELIELTT